MTEEPRRSLTNEQKQRIIAIALDLAREGKTDELFEFIEHGLGVDIVDEDGNTPLMLAAYHGHADTVARLLAAGADPDLLNSRGQSVIAGALFKGEDAVVRALIERGADLDAGTPTARDAAAMFGKADLLPPASPN